MVAVIVVHVDTMCWSHFLAVTVMTVWAVIGVQKVTVTFILVTQIVSKLQNDCLLSGQEQACSRIETCPPLFSLYTGELNLETAFRNQL